MAMKPSLCTQLFPLFLKHPTFSWRKLCFHSSQTFTNPTSSTTTHLLKPIKNPSYTHQLLAQMIVHNHPFDHFSFLKLISSNGFAFSASIFVQFGRFIDAHLCNEVVRSFTHLGKHWHSILVFVQMRRCGIHPDSLTFAAVIKSAGRLWRRRVGRSVHGCVIKMGFGSDLYVNTALVSMYCFCAAVEDARKVFDEMSERNGVSWNALITGYVYNRRFVEGVEVFKEMLRDGKEPWEVTVVEVLSICANLGALEYGKWVHDYVKRNGVALNVYVGTALVDMYAKCGSLEEGCEVFGAMRVRNVCTWNVLISAYVMNGRTEEALTAFYRMIIEDYKPDDVTFLGVLSACFQEGLVDEGRFHFRTMKEEFGVEPRIEHFSLMLDLLWRNGYVDEAMELIRTLPLKPDPVIWRAMLRISYFHRNTYLSELVIVKLIELEPTNGDNFFLLSNLYSQQQRWGEVAEVRETMKARGIQKIPGYSSIEISKQVYEFVASCCTEPGLEEVYEILGNMDKDVMPVRFVADCELL